MYVDLSQTHNGCPTQAAATLTELRFPAQGCGRSPLPRVAAPLSRNSVGVALSRRRYKPGSALFLVYAINKRNKKRFAPFQGFALCVRACRIISRERALGYSPPRPFSLPDGRLKRGKSRPPLAVKSPASPVQKRDYRIFYRYAYKIGKYKQVFFTANGGLFERPRAAFFTVAAAGVMPCMTVVMVGTMRRKTRFPTGVTTSATKAKPPAAATAFCVLSLPYLILGVVAFAIGLLIYLLLLTPSANRNSYRVATIEGIITQGRGASPLNPGL